MPQPKLKIDQCILSLILFFSLTSKAADSASFRTPAKRYGSAYSVKLTLWKEGVSFVVPAWIRLDQKESTIDRGQIAFMGWTYPYLNVEEVEVSGFPLEIQKFKASRSDWAVVPDYPKNCCMAVIGQDVLKNYQLRFDPAEPTHIEWTRIPVSQKPKPPGKEFERELKALFSIEKVMIRSGGDTRDLSKTSYRVDPVAQTVKFEKDTAAAFPGVAQAVFHYEFLPPYRRLSVTGVNHKGKKGGSPAFHSGVVVVDLNGESVSSLNRFEIEEYLKGRKAKVLEIGFFSDRDHEVRLKANYDFEKHEFIEAGSVPSDSRRN
jgi:hypothetical protein